VIVSLQEVGGVAVTTPFDVILELDLNNDGTIDANHTFTNLSVPASGAQNLTHTFVTSIPYTPQSLVRARIDPTNVVTESNEGDNDPDMLIGGTVPPINMTLDLDPADLVRGGGTVDITYDTNATFAMDCTLNGPALSTLSFNPASTSPSGMETAGPINAKSVYTLECEEPITGTVFIETASVETTGEIEEI
jgi:hypothetical protein